MSAFRHFFISNIERDQVTLDREELKALAPVPMVGVLSSHSMYRGNDDNVMIETRKLRSAQRDVLFSARGLANNV